MSLSVADEGYSNNALCAVYYIYTFLFVYYYDVRWVDANADGLN